MYGLLAVAMSITSYYVGCNVGYEVGVVTKTANDILMNQDKVMCHYVGKKCNAGKKICKSTYTD